MVRHSPFMIHGVNDVLAVTIASHYVYTKCGCLIVFRANDCPYCDLHAFLFSLCICVFLLYLIFLIKDNQLIGKYTL